MTGYLLTALFLLLSNGRKAEALSDEVYNCILACGRKETNTCFQCVIDPPINKNMCGYACKHSLFSAQFASICYTCFERNPRLMEDMCGNLCKDHHPVTLQLTNLCSICANEFHYM